MKRAVQQHWGIHCWGLHTELWGPHHFLRGTTLFFPVTPPSPAHVSSSLQPLISQHLLSPCPQQKGLSALPFCFRRKGGLLTH